MNARRTESTDVVELEKLISPVILNIFGKVNLGNIVEKSLLSMTITEINSNIMGFASFYDYPRINGYDEADDWNDIYELKNISNANPNNSLFIHHFIGAESSEISVLTEIIETVFIAHPDIHFLFLTVPSTTSLGIFNDIFDEAELKDLSINYAFYHVKREQYMPRLYIRPARPEDNDALTPIFDKQSKMLNKVYGEFYIAEMIAAQNEDIKCFVAEVDEIAVGFICVSKKCNVNILSSTHYTENFEKFKKPLIPKIENQVTSYEDETGLKKTGAEEEKSSSEHSIPVQQVEDALQNDSPDDSYCSISSVSLKKPPLFRKMTDDIPESELCNSLIIQLFAIDGLYDSRSIDFLRKVFKEFPNVDYLLITVPFMVPEFPLLSNFVRLIPRDYMILPHEVYCFHKATLYGLIKGLNIRFACKSDHKSIELLISNMKHKERILKDLDYYFHSRRFPDSNKISALVAETCGQIVGVAVLCDEENIEYIRSHYNIEDFIYFVHHKRGEHGRLKHFILNPIFKRFSNQFMKDILRKTHFTALYHNIYKKGSPAELESQFTHLSNLDKLVVVKPRRQIVYNLEDLGENAPSDKILKEQECFCLMHLNKKLIMEPKIIVNARIVVVGASTTGLSFLEKLAFCSHLQFNNLILVSPNGLPDDYEDDPYLEQLMGKDFYFSKKQIKSSSIRIQSAVVKGYMTKLDRKKKVITVSDKFLLPYDHLIISTGLQYTLPCPTEANIEENPTTEEAPYPPNRRYSDVVRKKKAKKVIPENFFTVNDPFEAVKLLKYVRKNIKNSSLNNNIIVYGYCFEVYCCIETLLSMGIPGHKIQFIKPPLEDVCTPLNNPVVESTVYNALRAARVSIYQDYNVAQFNDSPNVPSHIKSISFTSNGPPLKLECDIFISYFKKVVNYDAFKAMNDACLVFDSRLVIDALCHTNDPCIRGVGTVTKFKRKYYSCDWSHADFNGYVIGKDLAKSFLTLFDPTVSPRSLPVTDADALIPMFQDQLVKSGILPGGYMYLDVSKPNYSMPLEEKETQTSYGNALQTGDPDSEIGYFRLHLNRYDKIETITCLRKKTYPVENFNQLFGIHERALNNLLSRYKEGLITDFYSFFSEAWVNVFYHDRFRYLKDEISDLLVCRRDESTKSFDQMIRTLADGTGVTSEDKLELMRNFKRSGAKDTIDGRIINFLAYNYYHLPMYAKPDMV